MNSAVVLRDLATLIRKRDRLEPYPALVLGEDFHTFEDEEEYDVLS